MVCLTCGRVRPANDRSEYTIERGNLVAERGLCVCVAAPVPAEPRPTESIELPEDVLAPLAVSD